MTSNPPNEPCPVAKAAPAKAIDKISTITAATIISILAKIIDSAESMLSVNVDSNSPVIGDIEEDGEVLRKGANIFLNASMLR